jgi:two-component system, cell cycle sensor histidine kinase and response regulator CckA
MGMVRKVLSYCYCDDFMDQTRVLSKRILLVDDEQTVRQTIKLLLQMDQHAVTEAKDGREALDLYKPESFDLVITDFSMPRMQGNELAVRIKQLAPAQPIVMITAYAARLGTAENPVDAVLSKPFGFQELRQAIRKVLAGEY